MTVIHIVMFEFKPTVEKAKIEEICANMLGLKNSCVHPTTKAPYIKSASGGKQSNPEPTAVYQYGFVVEFETEEDWKYYLEKDPAHIEFKSGLKGCVEKVGCFDYQPSVL